MQAGVSLGPKQQAVHNAGQATQHPSCYREEDESGPGSTSDTSDPKNGSFSRRNKYQKSMQKEAGSRILRIYTHFIVLMGVIALSLVDFLIFDFRICD